MSVRFRAELERRINALWYQRPVPPWPLRALAAVHARRAFDRPCAAPPCPVVVVGNLVVGGSGKTPVVAALARAARAAGLRAAVITRGFGARRRARVHRATLQTPSRAVGDEARELAATTGCPVWVAADRAAALARAVHEGAEVVFSDDGLQHAALPRSFEICVIDARRGFGNGRLLPAGPLRQPVERLAGVDQVLIKHGEPACAGLPEGLFFRLVAEPLEAVHGRIGAPRPPARIDAVAGIADPEPFFAMLRERGFALREHRLADHQPLAPRWLKRLPGPVVMTRKDAMRLAGAPRPDLFVLPVHADLPAPLVDRVLGHVREFRS